MSTCLLQAGECKFSPIFTELGKHTLARPCTDLKDKRILESRRDKIRKFLRHQRRQTGRTTADIISQSLTRDELAGALQLFMERVAPDGDTGSVLPSPMTEVKDEPQDGNGSPRPVRIHKYRVPLKGFGQVL